MSEETESEELPGVEATLRWLDEHGIKPYRFALDNGIDPRSFARILKKETGIALETAVKIERGTKGAIKADMFVAKARES
jgi:plasmid maintenance system antidote protein VapI